MFTKPTSLLTYWLFCNVLYKNIIDPSHISPLALLVLILFLMIAGCKGTETTNPKSTSDSTPTASASDSDKSELEELYWARLDSSKMSFTQADVKFMTGMIAHHAQALVMSRLAPKNNASASIQRLASRIINAQKDEIASMQQWLKDRNQPVPKFEIEGLNLMVEISGEPWTMYKKMNGVLSDQQLQELGAAEGTEFDRLFLTYMIEHHSGAVQMVTKLFGTDGAAQDEQAFRLASNIQVDQRTEIERMRLMLDELPE